MRGLRWHSMRRVSAGGKRQGTITIAGDSNIGGDLAIQQWSGAVPCSEEQTLRSAETKYAHSNGVNIAYQVVGEGPLDLVFVMGWVSNLDYFWEEPHVARFLRRLASFSRLILFDKRGTGLSDRAVGVPSLEERMDDLRAVMDAVGSPRAALLGVSEAGPLCSLFAATYPERTLGLVLIGSVPRRLCAPDYPWGATAVDRTRRLQEIEQVWGVRRPPPVTWSGGHPA
jgi:pimeloyl-ACP methyl ester carboxylesterase